MEDPGAELNDPFADESGSTTLQDPERMLNVPAGVSTCEVSHVTTVAACLTAFNQPADKLLTRSDDSADSHRQNLPVTRISSGLWKPPSVSAGGEQPVGRGRHRPQWHPSHLRQGGGPQLPVHHRVPRRIVSHPCV